MKYGGLNETEALSLVTINPARQLGIDNRVGSIDVGKDADLVIYDKYPLSDYAKVQKVLIDGKVYFDRDTEVSGLAAKSAEKQKLVDKLKQQQQQQNGGRGGRGGRGQ
jgi:adenine deaminase